MIVSKQLFLFFLIFAPISTQAMSAKEESRPSRPSHIMATVTKGPDSYQALLLDSTIGLGEEWSLTGSYFKSDSGVATLLNEKLISSEARLAGDWQINRTWGGTLGFISKEDPYAIYGRGAFLSARAVISDWWRGKRASTLNVQLEKVKISQDITIQGRFASIQIQKELDQKSTSVSFDQEFLDWLSVSLGHTEYTYSENTGQLTLYTSKRKTSWGAGSGSSYGYPEWTSKVELTIAPWDWMEMRPGVSQTKILNKDTKSQSKSLGLSFFWKGFQLDADYSETDYGDQSGTDEPVQSNTSVGVGYRW